MSEAIGCTGVWKTFGDTIANKDVSLSVARGEVHAVIGENGAGKSTLMRALIGLSPPDRGEVRIAGDEVARPTVEGSLARGVAMVHQHFMLVPSLTVLENVVLGREPVRGPLLELGRAAEELRALGERYQLAIDPERRVSDLGVGELQRIEIVKVLWRGADVLVLDEPTAVLTPLEVERLFTVLRQLVAGGKTIVLVTHKLDEVMQLADRVTILRRGEVVATLACEKTNAKELARAMVGHGVDLEPPQAVTEVGSVRLSVKDLACERLHGVSFEIRAREIVGVAGVEGNGQTELVLALAGLEPASRGVVFLDGRDVSRASVASRRELGLAHVPADRHRHGLALDFTVAENVLLGREEKLARRWIDFPALQKETARIIAHLDVRPTDPNARARELSGGNQQKVVVGRELGQKISTLLCAQPTRGVDIGAATRIHREILEAKKSGAAVLLVSAELDELLALSDRILVMYKGKIVGDRHVRGGDRERAKSEIGALMLGAGGPG